MIEAEEVELLLDDDPGQFVQLPHGLFKLTNPEAVVRGRVHVFRYSPFDQVTTIVAVGLMPAGTRSESS
jgi:hypothetical protein